MAVFITRMFLLFLFTYQINEARLVENAEIGIQRDSLTRSTGVLEELSRKPRHSDEWSKTIQLGRKCKDGEACDSETDVSIDSPKPCVRSMNCEDKILSRGRKNERFIMNVAPETRLVGFKRTLEVLARKSLCRAENPRCERKRALMTTRKFPYQCPFGLRCAKKRYDPRTAKIVCQPGFNCGNSELKSEDSSTKLPQENELDEGKEHCPIGLWCSPKRELGFESSDTLEDCPPGLWCKRNGIQTRPHSFTKQANKEREEYQCPTGLWCTIKREEGYENFETLSHCPPGLWCKREETKSEDDNNTPQETDISKFEECPTGLWCTSKRQVGYENSETIKHCPPGLWCKKNTIVNEDENIELNDVADNCPNGLRCSTKRQEGYENTETLQQCPPGLWCKRSVPRGSDIFKEQRNAKTQDCPTGLWCALKREVAANIKMSDVCPPGLWCKRNGAKNEEALIPRGNSCTEGSWCSLKQKLGITNKNALVKK